MDNRFIYMTDIIDVYSRFIVGWGLSNTLETKASLEVIKQSVATHVKDEQ
jgi:putative transposase